MKIHWKKPVLVKIDVKKLTLAGSGKSNEGKNSTDTAKKI